MNSKFKSDVEISHSDIHIFSLSVEHLMKIIEILEVVKTGALPVKAFSPA